MMTIIPYMLREHDEGWHTYMRHTYYDFMWIWIAYDSIDQKLGLGNGPWNLTFNCTLRYLWMNFTKASIYKLLSFTLALLMQSSYHLTNMTGQGSLRLALELAHLPVLSHRFVKRVRVREPVVFNNLRIQRQGCLLSVKLIENELSAIWFFVFFHFAFAYSESGAYLIF